MPKDIKDARLGGPIAMLKVQACKTMELCARESSQIMGGIGMTKGTQGGRSGSLLSLF